MASMGDLSDAFKKAAKGVKPEAAEKLRGLSQVGVGLTKRAIQNRHAVATSAMLNSTTAERVSDTEYLIGPTVDYAIYVALGTSKMPARPFHTDAAKGIADAAKDFDLKMGGL